MRLFHATTPDAARSIVRTGFKDEKGTYLTPHIWRGVWLSTDVPTTQDGARGNTVLSVIIDGRKIARYEWKEKGKGFREWLIPANILKKYATVRLLSREEADCISPRGTP